MTTSIAAEELANGELVRLHLRPALRWSVPLALAYRAHDHDNSPIPAVRDAVRLLNSSSLPP